ncbi:MAG: hypothetical protein HZA50_09365 [Planctomycetes bacterium]|nr:hypothetical protein [Planctomycetota bacterium]
MNEIEFIRKLSAAAKADSPPPIDVAASVMREICLARPQRETLFWLLAGASSIAAAAVVAVMALVSWSGATDPMNSIFSGFAMVMP